MTIEAVVWLSALAPLLPFGIGVYNRATWSRPRARMESASAPGSISVLVPARNEEANIQAAVESALAQGPIVGEVIVYSDESTDGTEDIVRALCARDARVRLLEGRPLPGGWVGKPHACHTLGAAAHGPLLLFIDADVRLEPGALEGLHASWLGAARPDVLTLVPRQVASGFWLRVLQSLLLLTYVSWLPLAWSNQRKSARLLAGCGQMMLIERVTFERLGGFLEVRNAVVDDLEFCRRARERGARVAFFDGHDLAVCRMYQSVADFWAGFAKNVFLGLRSELNLAVAVVLHLTCFVLPYLLLAAGLISAVREQPWPDAWLGLASLGVLLNIAHRAVLARRHRQGFWAALLHPLAVLLLVALAFDSWRRTRLSGVQWSGRKYQGRFV